MTLFRSSILNPQAAEQCDFYQDGGLLVNDSGLVEAIGNFEVLRQEAHDEIIELTDGILVPSFADVHVHMPQNHVKGKFENALLPWLKDCIWPEESRFEDPDFSDQKAREFYLEMAKQGTLLSLVFGTIHRASVKAIFRHKIGHTIAGNVLMDQNSPEYLQHGTQKGIALTEALAVTYGEDFAVTPRFAPTCSMDLMKTVAKIAKKHNSWVHTHLSENTDEVKWVAELFPESASYTDVYYQAGLLGPKTVMAHCIHLSDEELTLLKKTGTRIAHCPTSNIALGSGRMPLEKMREYDLPFALASDVGAGPSLSMLHVMQKFLSEHRNAGLTVKSEEALYRATLAGAELLNKNSIMGNLSTGKEANFVLLQAGGKASNAADVIEDLCEGGMAELEKKAKATYFKGKPVY